MSFMFGTPLHGTEYVKNKIQKDTLKFNQQAHRLWLHKSDHIHIYVSDVKLSFSLLMSSRISSGLHCGDAAKHLIMIQSTKLDDSIRSGRSFEIGFIKNKIGALTLERKISTKCLPGHLWIYSMLTTFQWHFYLRYILPKN